jgi:GNAT superfamily N-acetyltransferase
MCSSIQKQRERGTLNTPFSEDSQRMKSGARRCCSSRTWAHKSLPKARRAKRRSANCTSATAEAELSQAVLNSVGLRGSSMKSIEWKSGVFEVTTDRDRLEIQTIHDFLALESEWARGIAREIVERSIEHSLCFGVFHRNRQVGFARVITDCATIAYLGDVFILKDYRGRGLAKWLMECVVAHPALQGLRRWILVTADAHDLYRKYGFTPLARPERLMAS